MKLVCHYTAGSRRSEHVARSMAAGAVARGDTAEIVEGFDPVVRGDVVAAYGWRHPELFEAYRAAGKDFIYIDLGWWGRKPANQLLDGYHKVSVNGRDPGPYFRRGSTPDRFMVHGQHIAPWRGPGYHILLAGMSGKSAKTRGFEPQQWEREMIDRIKALTDRPIVYRPKPSWADATPLAGTTFSHGSNPISHALQRAHAVVTLHSNVSVDALLAGVPVICRGGVGAELSGEIGQLENPPMPDGRHELMADIAWCQFSGAEMRDGTCWRHLKAEVLGRCG